MPTPHEFMRRRFFADAKLCAQFCIPTSSTLQLARLSRAGVLPASATYRFANAISALRLIMPLPFPLGYLYRSTGLDSNQRSRLLWCERRDSNPHESQGLSLSRLPVTPLSQKLVGVQRFELWTPAPQTQCSTRLSYTPKYSGVPARIRT